MPRSDRTQQALERLTALRASTDSTALAKELTAYLGNRSNLVIAKAAKIAREQGLSALVPELVRAFEELMGESARKGWSGRNIRRHWQKSCLCLSIRKLPRDWERRVRWPATAETLACWRFASRRWWAIPIPK